MTNQLFRDGVRAAAALANQGEHTALGVVLSSEGTGAPQMAVSDLHLRSEHFSPSAHIDKVTVLHRPDLQRRLSAVILSHPGEDPLPAISDILRYNLGLHERGAVPRSAFLGRATALPRLGGTVLSLIRPRSGNVTNQINLLSIRGYDEATPAQKNAMLGRASFDVLRIIIGEGGRTLMAGADYRDFLS